MPFLSLPFHLSLAFRTNCPRGWNSFSSLPLPTAVDLIETKKQSESALAAANEVNLINAHCVLISAFDLCSGSGENRQSATMIIFYTFQKKYVCFKDMNFKALKIETFFRIKKKYILHFLKFINALKKILK